MIIILWDSWELFLIKKLLKSKIFGSLVLFIGPIKLIKRLKSQQTTATILAIVPFNASAAKKIKREGREEKRKCEMQPQDPNHTIIKNQMFQPFTQVKTCKNYSCKEN